MKRLLLLLSIATSATAGILSTPMPPTYLILLADKSVEQGKVAPKSQEECEARAKALIPQGYCSIRLGFTNTGTCDDVPKPSLARELDQDGYVVKPPIRGKQLSDTDWTTEIQDYVPAPYPTCWVMGWREITQADVDDEPELASVGEPVWHTPEEKAQADAFEVVWNLPENVAARAEYERLHPDVLDGACGRYDSVECGGPG